MLILPARLRGGSVVKSDVIEATVAGLEPLTDHYRLARKNHDRSAIDRG